MRQPFQFSILAPLALAVVVAVPLALWRTPDGRMFLAVLALFFGGVLCYVVGAVIGMQLDRDGRHLFMVLGGLCGMLAYGFILCTGMGIG